MSQSEHEAPVPSTPAPVAWMDEPAFTAWFLANYPPGCVITNPAWHAPKIWRAAHPVPALPDTTPGDTQSALVRESGGLTATGIAARAFIRASDAALTAEAEMFQPGRMHHNGPRRVTVELEVHRARLLRDWIEQQLVPCVSPSEGSAPDTPTAYQCVCDADEGEGHLPFCVLSNPVPPSAPDTLHPRGVTEVSNPAAGTPIAITVNGVDHAIPQPADGSTQYGALLSYDEIVALAGKTGTPTVVVHYPEWCTHRDRTVTPGGTCPLIFSMHIDCVHTNNA